MYIGPVDPCETVLIESVLLNINIGPVEPCETVIMQSVLLNINIGAQI